MGEVVLDPHALEAFSASSRRRLLAIDTAGYDAALSDFAAARNDIGAGDVASLSGRVADTLGELERLNRSCEAFVDQMVGLDARYAAGDVVRTSLSRADFDAMVRAWQRRPTSDLLASAPAVQASQALAAAVRRANDLSLSQPVRDAADQQVLRLLDQLIGLGVNDDPAVQAAVITSLGADGVEAFAGRLAAVERDAGHPVPWVTAGMELLADWTASAANGYGHDQLAGFLEAMPAELVTTLNLLAPWNARAGAQAAADVWARPGVGAGLDPVVPVSLAHRGWPEPSGNGDRAAIMLATNPGAAQELLTDDVVILADLVTATDHPAAAAAVTAGLVTHPRHLFDRDGDTSGVQASADAFAELMDHDAGLGRTELSTGGRAALERVAGFHFELMDDGVRPAADAFLDGANGTFASLATTFLRHQLAARPDAVHALAQRMDATDLGRLTTTLADPEVRANHALVAVGHQVVTRLDQLGTPHAAAFLDDLGVQPVADLSVGTAASGDMAAMRRIGASFVDAIGGMEVDGQAQWLSLLGVANDRAGVVPLLLSSTDAPPRSFLPLLLASEGSGTLIPRSDDVVTAVHDLTGDWRQWSADTYTALLRATSEVADTLVDAMSGWRSDPGLRDVIERRWDARNASEVILHAGGTAGLDKAVSDWSATHPEFLTSLATSVRRITESRDEALVAVMRMVRAAGNPNQVLARYIDHAMSSIGTGGSLSLDDVFEVGQQVAIVQAASRPTRISVDGTGFLVDGSIAVASAALGPAIDAVDIFLSNVSIEGPDFNPGIDQRRAILAGTAPLILARLPDGDEVLRAMGFERNRSGSWFVPQGRVLDADATIRRHPEFEDEIDTALRYVEGIVAGSGQAS